MKAVYFVGIGGIGMSAIARYYIKKGIAVGGYDKTPSDLTRQLESEGARIHYTDDVALIPDEFRSAADTLVVYTPAIPKDHTEMQWFMAQGFDMQKRAQVLGTLTRSLKALCVSGTHGKTTTSSMTAHILHQSIGCNAFLGGITKNYGTNYLIDADSPWVVIEADEFDRSFHHLTPWATVVTSTDSDHLDIYGTREAYLESFAHYTSLVQPGGYVIAHVGQDLVPAPQAGVTVYSYGREEGDFHAANLRIGGGEIVFDLVSPLGNIADVQLGVPVAINIDNGIAAMALAQLAGVPAADIRRAMATFGGVDRRFDFRVKTDRVVYLSDYAHHPEELRQSILSIRQLYPTRRVVGAFQPHLYTRTRDFYREFADALSLLDEVLLLPIYPARELPIEGVNSQLIASHLKLGTPHRLVTTDELLRIVQSEPVDVFMTLGAGDLENLSGTIASTLQQRI